MDGHQRGLQMPVKRMSFNDTSSLRDSIGFINRVKLEYDTDADNPVITIKKGSLVYGFKQGNSPSYGYVIDSDFSFPISASDNKAIFYITIDINGILRSEVGNFSNVRGIGFNTTGIPWYTLPVAGSYPVRALIAKVFKTNGFISGWIICDDAFWCEYEGEEFLV